ncbi:MAG TPA: S1/P1 nuclease [Gammaproteobacteria bacterium]|nr:S1/P1 nuclease [Gammaproteobacteria bacterium]
MTLKKFVAIFTLFLLVMPLTWAWNATGHMLVAQLAYDQLNEKTKARVANILGGDDFITASVWADDIKAQGNDSMNRWHYINLPEPYEENVVWAINQSVAVLKDPKASKAAQKQALKGLLHWVGDIHQPLHATSRDRGGTLFFLAKNPDGKNLHQYWDKGAGALPYLKRPLSLKSKQWLQDTAHAWQQAYPPTATQLKQTDPMQWAQESFLIAQTRGFVGVSPKQVPSSAYQTEVQALTERQIVLAGARLAQVLNALGN